MSETAPSNRQTSVRPEPGTPWRVRPAVSSDVTEIATAVRALLVELGGSPPEPMAMEHAARSLLEDTYAGAVLVAEADAALVGVLAVSWQEAIHVPGRYALIQDLWVDPGWRGRAVGGALLDGLWALVRERRIARVEVCLPRESFAAIRATEAFYLANGFEVLGPRMRRALQ